VQPWGAEARIELRSLRPAVRRRLLAWLAGRSELAVAAAARRTVIVVPATQAAAAVAGGSRRQVVLLAARDGEHCVWCCKPLTGRSPDATVDHVRCRSHGGSNALDNLVLACAHCNHRRSNAPADVWLERRLAAGAAVDVEAVASAIRRSAGHHRARLRRAAAEREWHDVAAA
jgi:5-methylcytosine-specific restriction endonuclease McrA